MFQTWLYNLACSVVLLIRFLFLVDCSGICNHGDFPYLIGCCCESVFMDCEQTVHEAWDIV